MYYRACNSDKQVSDMLIALVAELLAELLATMPAMELAKT